MDKLEITLEEIKKSLASIEATIAKRNRTVDITIKVADIASRVLVPIATFVLGLYLNKLI